ncbi:MAG TPA: DUF6491 family protein [Spongiibacteraceae bacterium]|nr:DUF6491 family protein [Spongiibacteraceae bacterium]
MIASNQVTRYIGATPPLARTVLCALLLFGLNDGSFADDKTANTAATAEKAERCISIRSIKQTKVLDDQNVLFYTAGNRNYKNHLAYPCSGLAIADSFMYRTSESKLCNVDIITVLNRMGGGGTQGASCGLGMFEEIDQQQLDALTKKPVKQKTAEQ